MPSAAILDFEGLLKPFEGPTASGKDLRADSSPSSLYQLLKEDRKAARQLETRISKGRHRGPSPEWRPVVEKATKILAEQSKDLEVCAYLIEALVRMHGFAGMRDGYRLAGGLVERFWNDGLYPSPVETDVERRCAHLLQLNGLDAPGALIPPLGRIPFTEMTSLGQFSRVQLQEAQALAKIADPKARQAKVDAGMISPETIHRAVVETKPEFYQTLFEDASLALEEFGRFNATLKQKSDYDPPSGNIQQAIQSYLDIVKDLTRSKPAAKPKETKARRSPAPPGRREDPGAPREAERGDRQPGGCPRADPRRRRIFPADRAAVDRALRAGAGGALGQALAPRAPRGTDRGRSPAQECLQAGRHQAAGAAEEVVTPGPSERSTSLGVNDHVIRQHP
jgi:type VI secretion system protein ImpA